MERVASEMLWCSLVWWVRQVQPHLAVHPSGWRWLCCWGVMMVLAVRLALIMMRLAGQLERGDKLCAHLLTGVAIV